MRDLDVLRLVSPRDVVGLSGLSGVEQEIDRRRVILHVEPVAHVAPVAVQRQRMAVDRVRHEERDQLLRILIGPVIVRGARHHDRHAVRRPVRIREAVAARLRGGVRVAGIQRRIFVERTFRDRAVDLVGRDLDELRNAPAARLLEQHEDAADVGLDERSVSQEGPVDVRFRGEIDDRVAAVHGKANHVGVRDVPLDETVVPPAGDVGQARRIRGVGELVEVDDGDPVAARLEEASDEVRPDEAAAPGDEDLHRIPISELSLTRKR